MFQYKADSLQEVINTQVSDAWLKVHEIQTDSAIANPYSNRWGGSYFCNVFPSLLLDALQIPRIIPILADVLKKACCSLLFKDERRIETLTFMQFEAIRQPSYSTIQSRQSSQVS
jgi:hypothetical protein